MATERITPGAAPVAIGRGLVASSFQFYLSGRESLRVTTINRSVDVTVNLVWRTWSEADRSIQINRDSMTALGSGASSVAEFGLAEGALINLRISTPTTPPRYGHMFVRVQLIQGSGAAAEIVGTILQGYLSSQNDLAWPGSPIQSMHDSKGIILDASWSQLAGPLRLEQTVPSGVRWRIISALFGYTCGGVAGPRTCFLRIITSLGVQQFLAFNIFSIDAGNTIFYSVGATVNQGDITNSGCVYMPLPADLELGAGSIIQVTVITDHPGDFFQIHGLFVREWLDQ
jgi:hypothetical protein